MFSEVTLEFIVTGDKAARLRVKVIGGVFPQQRPEAVSNSETEPPWEDGDDDASETRKSNFYDYSTVKRK